MECTRWRDLVSDYVEGTLGSNTHNAMEGHLSGCAACRADVAAVRAITRELNVLPDVDSPLFFRENVLAAIERDGSRKASPGGWAAQLWPQLGRAALGTLVAGGAAFAVAWTLTFPLRSEAPAGTSGVSGPIVASVPLGTDAVGRLLPGDDSPGPADAHQPHLRITRAVTMTPNSSGPAYDFSFWLDGADGGTARWQFLGDPTAYRFTLNERVPQSVQIPASATFGKDVLALFIYWTANQAGHRRYLLLPLASGKDSVPAHRQSFGLPENTVAQAARQVAGRFGVAITINDVAAEDVRVSVTARDETAEETLRRNLAPLGLQVLSTRTGLEITHAASASHTLPAASVLPPAPVANP